MDRRVGNLRFAESSCPVSLPPEQHGVRAVQKFLPNGAAQFRRGQPRSDQVGPLCVTALSESASHPAQMSNIPIASPVPHCGWMLTIESGKCDEVG